MLKNRFPGVYASLADIADFVQKAAADIGFNATDMFAIETAVDEAVSNIIEHAYEGEGKGDIDCSIETIDNGIRIILEDFGKPFDPSRVPVPDLTADLDDRMEHGLGVYMMCQLLDEVHFDFLEDRNQVVMLKRKSVEEPIPVELPVQPQWRHYLRIGEDLLKQPNALAISNNFANTVKLELNCSAWLYLAEPFYPLPGEPSIETLPSMSNIEDLVKQAWTEQKIITDNMDVDQSEKRCHKIAIPVKPQQNLLGVLLASRPQGFPFSDDEIQRLEGIVAFAAIFMQMNRQEVLKNWRYDQISLVKSVSSQIANVLDLDELCKRVTNLIQCSFHYYYVALYTLEEGSDHLILRANSLDCEPGSDSILRTVKIGDGLVGQVALAGTEIVARDVKKDPRYRSVEELPDTRSEAVLPLVIENRVLGVLDVQSNHVDAFHKTDMLVVRSLADNIALAVEGARLFNKLDERARQMSAVAEINLALSSILDLDELLKEIVTVIHDRFTIPLVHIYTVHSGRRKVIFQSGSGKRAENLKINSFAFDLDAPLGMIPNVARTGISMLANDVTKEPLFKPSRNAPNETKSELTIPLKFGDQVLGVLDMQSNEIGKFNQSQLSLFEGLASGIALSIRNATLFRAENWRRKVAEIFKDVAGMLSSDLALDALLERILSQLEHTMPCDSSAIWLLDNHETDDPEKKILHLAAVRGVNKIQVIQSREKSESVKRFLEMAVNKTEPVLRTTADPYGPLGAAGNYPADYSSLSVPLLSGDSVIGILTMAHHASGRYGSEASLIASTFASYAAVAIENARLYTDAQQDAWSSTVLLQVAEAIQSISSVDELLATMVRLTPLLVGIKQCAFFLKEQQTNSFPLSAWYGFTPPQTPFALTDDLSIALIKMCLTREPVFIQDPYSELGISTLSHHVDSGTLVLIPLMAHDEILGAFLVSHDSMGEFGIRKEFNEQTLAILQGIGRQTSIALENIRLVENRQEEAYITAVLLQVAQAVVSQNQLDDILDTIVHLMPILVGVKTCVILLKDHDKNCLTASNAVAESRTETDLLLQQSYEQGEFLFLDRLLNEAQMLTCPLDNPDLQISDWLNLDCQAVDENNASAHEHWLIGVPLVVKGVIYGALIAKETNVQPAFHAKRMELIRGVAQQTTLAIQNERLKQEMVGRERIEREFQLARQIQKNFLPESLPEHPDWDFDMRWQTAREVGGDFYDLFETKDHKLALVIADVADKGMPAAMYMTVTRTLIRATAQGLSSPGKILERVNELLEAESRNGMFVTAFLGLLDRQTGILEYANAGHNLPLLIRTKKHEIEHLQKDGIALGVLPGACYGNKQITMHANDLLLLYTDGVTEAFSSSGELFSEPRLVELMKNSQCIGAAGLLSSIEETINTFRNGEPVSDDLTMIAIFRKQE